MRRRLSFNNGSLLLLLCLGAGWNRSRLDRVMWVLWVRDRGLL